MYGEENWTAITQERCEQYWTSPGGNTPESSSSTATYHPSRGARGVVVIVVGNGPGDSSSNPGQDWLHFTKH